jgi:hypothetical protein
MKFLPLVLSFSCLAACSQNQPDVRLTSQSSTQRPVVAKAVSRTEPVFYNGKTYRVTLESEASGSFKVAVDGMSSAQQKDAVAVATSTVRYFGCPDGKTGKLLNTPRHDSGSWLMSARCG